MAQTHYSWKSHIMNTGTTRIKVNAYEFIVNMLPWSWQVCNYDQIIPLFWTSQRYVQVLFLQNAWPFIELDSIFPMKWPHLLQMVWLVFVWTTVTLCSEVFQVSSFIICKAFRKLLHVLSQTVLMQHPYRYVIPHNGVSNPGAYPMWESS